MENSNNKSDTTATAAVVSSSMHSVERTLSVIGTASVGKSALTIQLTQGLFTEEYKPTIANTYHHLLQNGLNKYYLTIYDTGGLEKHSQIPSYCTTTSHGYALVYSITDVQSFETIQHIYNMLCDELNGRMAPIILIGNKSDLDSNRQVEFEEGRQLASKWGVYFMEASAKNGESVGQIFLKLIESIDRMNETAQEERSHVVVPVNASSRHQLGKNSKCTIS